MAAASQTMVVVTVVDGNHRVLVRAEGPLARLEHVDWLARLVLLARRSGWRVTVRPADSDLVGLLGFLGLAGLVAGEPPSGLEAVGEPEGGEQLRVEEVVDGGDAPV